jgi:hypothetical protein
MKPVRCVPTIVTAYTARTNGGQVMAATARERAARFAQVCSGLRLACRSSMIGLPATSIGGATAISIRCWIMWSQKSTSS